MPQVQAAAQAERARPQAGTSPKSQLKQIDAKIAQVSKRIHDIQSILMRAMMTPEASQRLHTELTGLQKQLKTLNKDREAVIKKLVTQGGTFVIKKVAKFDTDLKAKRAELQQAKGVLMRALLTPEASRKAEARVRKLEGEVKGLETAREKFIKELIA